RATEWLKPSFARSSATMSASVRDQMPKPSCVSCQLGSPTTTRFTRTRLSDIVHPVSSSQLTQDPDRVRSFGGYNIGCKRVIRIAGIHKIGTRGAQQSFDLLDRQPPRASVLQHNSVNRFF